MEVFPFSSVREGQKQFMDDVSQCIREKKHLIANAPTGIGKTAATLAPALAYALENGKTVIFLTPKHSQHKIAVETLNRIKDRFKLQFSVVDIIGKKWLCPVPAIDILSTSDFADYCNAVKKDEKCVFYNATRSKEGLSQGASDAVGRILQTPMHAENIKEECRGLCPYEICLEAARKSQVIICDYYHIFSTVRKTFLNRTGKEMKDCILIVDEAHNLPERIRNVMSGKINSVSLGYAQKEAAAFGFHELSEDIETISRILKSLGRRLNEKNETFISKSDFLEEVSSIRDYQELIEDLAAASIEVREGRKKSFMGSLHKFLDLWPGEDIGYARILRKDFRNDRPIISLNYSCLDPMLMTKDIIQDSHSVILMSGTLTPMSMYKNLMGFGENTICSKYESCFPEHNRLNLVIPDVTTQYSKRTDDNMKKIADYILRISSSVKGNAAAFFPSYAFRENIYRHINDRCEKTIMLEQPDMNKEEKTRLFEAFMGTGNALLMGTQAGSFSEGMDYFGNILKCVMVVGISLSTPDLETQALIKYYDYKFNRGWDYGYIYPAVHRAMQSAGRCIRTEKDRAVVVFMDSRFLWKNYRAVFPVDMKISATTEPEKEIGRFFSPEN
jgi:DNA excision repair protein ERCC-2